MEVQSRHTSSSDKRMISDIDIAPGDGVVMTLVLPLLRRWHRDAARPPEEGRPRCASSERWRDSRGARRWRGEARERREQQVMHPRPSWYSGQGQASNNAVLTATEVRFGASPADKRSVTSFESCQLQSSRLPYRSSSMVSINRSDILRPGWRHRPSHVAAQAVKMRMAHNTIASTFKRVRAWGA